MKAKKSQRLTYTVSKLNIRMWFGLMGILLGLNLGLLFASAVYVVVHAEEKLERVKIALEEEHLEGESFFPLLDLQIYATKGPRGILLPRFLQPLFPEKTVHGLRSIHLTSLHPSFWHRIEGLVYRIEFYEYGIELTLEPVVSLLKRIFLVFLILQGYYLLKSVVSGGRLIGRTLLPLTELAEKAQSLSFDQGPFTQKEIDALAGKLEGITASDLDTPLELDSSQDELNHVTQAINKMLERINASYAAQARFVSDASHELRTPIAAIQGYANLLDRWGKHDTEALEESICAIKDEAASMKELIEQLLFLARGDNHSLALQKEAFSLKDLAHLVLKEFKMMDPSHVFSERLQDVWVVADMGLIKQVLRILMDNAIKYSKPGGGITLSVFAEQERGVLMVQDEGIGIPPDAVPRIFDRFFRADASRARATGGTGLGLSIAKWIVERHGGRIDVLSREGIGTRVSVFIPKSKEQGLQKKEGGHDLG